MTNSRLTEAWQRYTDNTPVESQACAANVTLVSGLRRQKAGYCALEVDDVEDRMPFGGCGSGTVYPTSPAK
jgi:hypothetical protein